MIFKNKHNNKADLHFRIEIDDKHIEKVEVTKFLGILIDDNLSWKSHTNHITKIVSKYNGIIRKVRPFLNKDSLHTLYNTLALPYLSYCTIVWGERNNSNLDSLFITQKKIIRTCTNSIWLEHTTPLFLSLKKIKSLTFIFNNLQSTCTGTTMTYFLMGSQIINSLYNPIFITIILGRPLTFISIQLILNLLKNTIKTQGPMIWNSVNKTIKNCRSLVSFKNSLKNIILAQYESNVTTNKYATLT